MEIAISILTSPLLWLTIVGLFALRKGILFVPQNRGYVIYTLGKYRGHSALVSILLSHSYSTLLPTET